MNNRISINITYLEPTADQLENVPNISPYTRITVFKKRPNINYETLDYINKEGSYHYRFEDKQEMTCMVSIITAVGYSINIQNNKFPIIRKTIGPIKGAAAKNSNNGIIHGVDADQWKFHRGQVGDRVVGILSGNDKQYHAIEYLIKIKKNGNHDLIIKVIPSGIPSEYDLKWIENQEKKIDITNRALEAFECGDYILARATALLCFHNFEKTAKIMQESLSIRPTENELFDYSDLNEAATCLFILGRIAEEEGQKEKAVEIYKDIIKTFPMAQRWDRKSYSLLQISTLAEARIKNINIAEANIEKISIAQGPWFQNPEVRDIIISHFNKSSLNKNS
jgi:tetratricopeptide (TPR) repeat protein